MVGPISLTMPLLEGKQLKVLAMTSPERLATAPNVPTMKEQGVPIVSEGWWGVCAASGTPAPVLEAINKQVVAAVNSPDFKTPIEKTGVIAGASSIDEVDEGLEGNRGRGGEALQGDRLREGGLTPLTAP